MKFHVIFVLVFFVGCAGPALRGEATEAGAVEFMHPDLKIGAVGVVVMAE